MSSSFPTSPYTRYFHVVDSEAPEQHSFGYDDGQASLTIDVEGETLLEFNIRDILGFSKISQQVITNPDLTTTLGDYFLSRYPPVRHPQFSWMFATRIVRVQGLGGQGQRRNDGYGHYWLYPRYRFQVLFATLPYDVLTDEELAQAGGGEWQRFVTKQQTITTELLTKPGNAFKWVRGSLQGQEIQGSLQKRVQKTHLIWTWEQVPEDWLLNSRGLPSAILPVIGGVNHAEFPPGNGFPRGTLLCLAPKITPKMLPIPATIVGNPQRDGVRTYTVEFNFSYFDPPYDPNVAPVGPEHPQGHNLFPHPTNTYWYYATAIRPGIGGGVNSPAGSETGTPLYDYVDFRQLFARAE